MKDQEIVDWVRGALYDLENYLDEMKPAERELVEDIQAAFERGEECVTERQLRWLRDLADRH